MLSNRSNRYQRLTGNRRYRRTQAPRVPMAYQRARQSLLENIRQFPGDASTLPSFLTLSRFLTRFFSDFHHHMPIIHTPSFDVPFMCKSFPELVLAIVAIGAMYRFQASTGKALHRVAKFLISAKEHYIATESIKAFISCKRSCYLKFMLFGRIRHLCLR